MRNPYTSAATRGTAVAEMRAEVSPGVGRDSRQLSKPQAWLCRHCGTTNDIAVRFCRECDEANAAFISRASLVET